MASSSLSVHPSIAVVIPVYNGAAYLSEAIESVLSQTVPANEIIVIDDGSKDESLAIVRSFPQVRVIAQANAGVSASRNNGVELSSSEWVAFLDQDDLWEPTKLQRQLETISTQPDAGVCIVGYRILYHLRDATTRLDSPILPPASDQIAPQLYGALRFVPSCTMIRRDIFREVGGFDPTASPCEDWDLWLRLEQANARFVSCSEPLVRYRAHAANESNNSRKMYLGELRTYERRVAPRIPALLRPIHRRQAESGFLAGMALVDREQDRPHLGNLLRSIVKYPFGNWRRYKITAYALLKAAHVVG